MQRESIPSAQSVSTNAPARLVATSYEHRVTGKSASWNLSCSISATKNREQGSDRTIFALRRSSFGRAWDLLGRDDLFHFVQSIKDMFRGLGDGYYRGRCLQKVAIPFPVLSW